MRQLAVAVYVLLLFFATGQGSAQDAPIATGSDMPFRYEVSRETTLTGTVADLLTSPAIGMLPGAHLLLTTLNGPIDVSLGVFALQGKDALTLTGGQQVEVTGVAKTLQGKQVFLARAVKVGNYTYAIRTVHGLPVTPRNRERANQNAQNGETR